MDGLSFLASIDRTMLTPIVRQALRSDEVEVVDWECRPLYGAGVIASVYRISGLGRAQGEEVPWSLILKSIQASEASEDPTHFRYWLREVLAYQSGLLADLPGNLAAPVCLGTFQPAADQYWLWLEEIMDSRDTHWSMESYGCAARHLGQFNGAYLTGAPLPTYPWLSRDHLWVWMRDALQPPLVQFQSFTEHPLASRFTPPGFAERMIHLWDERHTYFAALDRLPKTLCHLDAYHRNLFRQHSTRTIAIDWADVGLATLGEEIAPLVAGSIFFFGADPVDAQELDQVVFSSYLDGLHDVGWHGDPQTVRFAYAAASVLRFALAAGQGFVLDESKREMIEQIVGHPIEELVDQIAGLRRFLLDLADEADNLLQRLS